MNQSETKSQEEQQDYNLPVSIDIDEPEFELENCENEAVIPKEVNAARNREVKQIPDRKPITQTWHGNEVLINNALCETTLSRDLLLLLL